MRRSDIDILTKGLCCISKETYSIFLPFTPNTISYFWIGLGLLASVLISIKHYLAGLFFTYLYIYFDCVDGDVARARKMCSKKGEYIDDVGHTILEICFFAGVGYSLDKLTWGLWLCIINLYYKYSRFLKKH